MFKSEPKTILQFLATHFDLLRQLFDIQVKNEIILKSQINETLKEFESDLERQLFEHKILVEQNNDYIINEPFFVLFEFVLQQFKPLLPEEIEKYGQSIKNLFIEIKKENEGKNILLARLEALSKEINKFNNAVKNNTSSLLNESRELKANTRKIEYQEKVQKARYLIENYIIPLNNILDVNGNTIYNQLLDISRYSNYKRFDYSDESIRRQFEKLYNLLRQVEKDISQQSSILTNELLPLIDRIRTESEYLQGFHLYLTNGNCYKAIKPPELFNTTRDNLYNPFIYENTKEYFNQFKNEEDVFIEEETEIIKQWIFNKSEYKSQLNSKLPVDDFFTWCKTSLENENKNFDFDNYFMVTSLIFEEEYEVQQDKENRNISLKTEQGELIMPKLKITKKENVPE
ncbi:conserved hypothetical protein [Tenacibaculum maritimum]|uniref:hypothetical protein n=1 Tax=Tenacibaculum maritimum TaxID=107401 RepID=UPI0012E43712|nr:hypothetical protein [Tenacibaculum maritimum]CAA0176465.1 conserved hypothetical protein [Tenacibaculum maritimum]